ncbi:hypothetical protein F1529_07370 [Alcanivorax sp. VBW004]|jgi:hypothetical protein|uniref:hypothetical protein n=1 Tax=unclassified Alcanivorax TaxID=2638842 RepID=UPI0012BCB0E7|nr:MULTISPECIES: hypothetical protein [unclassified Alcanivorax]MTT52301.1 hypothetical protein [Alcanivorax sp. VBW004]
MVKKHTGHGLKTRNYADQGGLCQWEKPAEMMIGMRVSGGLGGLSLTFTGFLERP